MKVRFAIVICLSVALFSGCDIFSTRTPEPPDTGSSFIWTPATSVQYLVSDFKGALEALDGANYIRSFVSATDSVSGAGNATYQFNYTPGLDQASKTIFSGWNTESERAYVSKLKSILASGSKLTVLLSNQVIDQTSSTATVTMDYTVTIPVNSGSTVIPSVVSGSMTWQLVLVSTEQATREWRIATWSDFEQQGGQVASWTSLKVKLSS